MQCLRPATRSGPSRPTEKVARYHPFRYHLFGTWLFGTTPLRYHLFAVGIPTHNLTNKLTMAIKFLSLMLLAAPAASQMCPNSPMQLCKMLCPPTNCPQGQCAMRQGQCCSTKCQSAKGGGDKGQYNNGRNNDIDPGFSVDPGFGRAPSPPKKKGANLQACLQCIGQGKFYGQNGQCASNIFRFPSDGFGICGGSHSSTSRCCKAILKPRVGNGMWGRVSGGAVEAPPPHRGHGSGGVAGSRCVKGFSESGIKMPCARGLQCVVQPNTMCAGTCYGRCAGGH